MKPEILAALRDQQGLILAIVNLLLDASRTDQTLVPDIIDVITGAKSLRDLLKAHPGVVYGLIKRLPTLVDENSLGKILANL